MRLSLLCASALLAGCTAVTPILPEATGVTVVFDNTETPQQCVPLETYVGSEGHWYSYWFISNYHLTTGAINQLRNHAAKLGGNRVELSPAMDFETSVTFVGHLYRCPQP